MPIGIFEFAFQQTRSDESSKAAMQRLQKSLSGVSKQAIREQIKKHEGYDISVAEIGPIGSTIGLRVEIAMDEPPRRADTVKEIIDELDKIRRRIDVILDYEASSEFADAEWARVYGVTAVSKLTATRGFKVGSARKRSWWFPFGFVLGCAVTFYAFNFRIVNEQIVALISQLQQ